MALILARATIVLCSATSCATLPSGRYALQSVKVSGNAAVDAEDIRDEIASRESPRFLGLFSGMIYDYEVFDHYIFERDLQRVERYYRARGFYHAKVRAGRVLNRTGRNVSVEILVEEGAPMIVRRLDLYGVASLPPPLLTQVRRSVEGSVGVGMRFEEQAYAASEVALKEILSDAGYAYVQIRRAADVDLANDSVGVGFWIEAGPVAQIGEVRIIGLGSIPEKPVRRALAINPGDPYSTADLVSAERALLELGVFNTVSVKPEIDPDTTILQAEVVPIVVRVEPSKLRSVRLGGGAGIDAMRSEVHLRVGWEALNFLGGLRRFTTELVPGVVLYPMHLPTFARPDSLLPQVSLRSEFREPGFLEPRTHALVNAQASIYPVLLSADPVAAAPILGYRELRASVGLERSYRKLDAIVSHNIQINSPFTYRGERDPDLHTILVSYPAVTATLDVRDSQLSPHSGFYLSSNLQFAGVVGDARDWKLQPEARVYLPVSRRVTLAARGAFGLLFPMNYGSTVTPNALTKTSGGASRSDWVRDIQIMFLRGFFSGGPGSNRGYLPREIGPHGVVPFFNPGQTTTQIASQCNLASSDTSISLCNLPLGGFTLWEASLELRFPITGPIESVLFIDGSDVAPAVMGFRWRPHLSTGMGLRYATPIGPVRLDVGYRVPGMQAPDLPDEGTPKTILGAPIAISLGIGEAF